LCQEASLGFKQHLLCCVLQNNFLPVANQQNTAVSVVRVGSSTQGDDSSQDSNGTCDSQNDGNPHVNLTVEGFYPPSTAQTNSSEGKSVEEHLVPFSTCSSILLHFEACLQQGIYDMIYCESVGKIHNFWYGGGGKNFVWLMSGHFT
jgi:hypothetical protein